MSSPFLTFDTFVYHTDTILFYTVALFLLFPLLSFKNIFKLLNKSLGEGINKLFPLLSFKYTGLWSLLYVVFLFFFALNIFSLCVYIFTPTSHMIYTFTFGFAIWMMTMFIQFFLFLAHKMEHLTPMGTPLYLLSLMVIIELISQLIRPITLSVRLAANLTAGHLLLSLLSSLSIFSGLLLQLPLILLELLVAMVQPFVFCMLLFLYFSEN